MARAGTAQGDAGSGSGMTAQLVPCKVAPQRGAG